ncbi:putative toxin-antitoxin system toxin component, PIN family [bacterium]|nr:putative toxin-antitoxin system toxin component, PIN family [bacterium]
MRAVFDTNVLISAALFKQSVPRQALDKALREGVVLISDETQAELEEVLSRPKFDKYLTSTERLQFLTLFIEVAVQVVTTEVVVGSRDPKDNKFLSLAVNGQATHLVTGDQDLLGLHPFREVAILTPDTLSGAG